MTARRAVLAVGIAAFVGGCGGHQSVLNPKGPIASELAALSWLMFAFGTAVLVIVVVATAAAIRGSPQTRSALASPRAVVLGGIVFPLVTLSALLAYGVWHTRESQARLTMEGMLQIEVVGEQWWWRVVYRGADGAPIPAANEIRIPVGQPVLLTLTSADVVHSLWVPSLGGKVDMIPGRTTRLRLQADQAGVYRGQCAEYCGGPHALMAFEMIAMPADAFDNWLRAQAGPSAPPETGRATDGARLFLASGCGACHTVRGTSATGAIGPDLTRLGARRSVGIDTLAMTEANIAAFIRDGQHIKPGNLMPPFRVLEPGDLASVATYLAGLR
jgi:cytochrome c oxidase subunit 2